jgi:hypothetical protein
VGDLHHAAAASGALQLGRLARPHLQAQLDGKVLGMLGQSGKQLKQFGWIHAMACPSENVLYVAELLNWRVQKLFRRGWSAPSVVTLRPVGEPKNAAISRISAVSKYFA